MRLSHVRLGTAIIVAVFVAAACGSAPTPTPAPAVTSTPAAAAAPSTSPPPTPTTSAALTLDGTWVGPKAGARLTSYSTTLSAMPTASGPGVTTFTKVVFSGTWTDAPKTVMCKAKRPADSGAWSCRANLLALGVPPGRVVFSFDVYGEGVPVARSPAGPRRVTYAVPPPRPTNKRWAQIRAPNFERGDNTATYRLRWSAPTGYADEFLVYETWECPRESKKNDGTPCFVAGTPVNVSQLKLQARASGDARSVKVRLTEFDCDGHGTILLRARNAYGRSAFTIVEVVNVYWPDPNDVIC